MTARETALAIFDDVLRAVRADRLVRRAVTLDGAILRASDHAFDLDRFRTIKVFGAGKAACGMAEGLMSLIGRDVEGGLLVTKHGHALEIEGLDVLEGGHPVPDADSIRAGEAMLWEASQVNPHDLVIFLLSGGASAVMEAPVEGVTLEDLQATNQVLLASGASIRTINTVRRRLSRIKGGRLAEAFAPATVLCLVLSDVDGDHLPTIGSGPFVPADEDVTLGSAIEASLPPSVQAALRVEHRTLDYGIPHVVVGNREDALEALRTASETRGFQFDGFTFEGGSDHSITLGLLRDLPPNTVKAAVGEPSVYVPESAGMGGRAQHIALIALQDVLCSMHGEADVAFLAAGTDGTDGPTDAAGACVDRSHCFVDMPEALRAYDSASFHARHRTAMVIGPTQTNVNDVYFSIRLDP